ncbi:uncharacterized protein LOC123884817 [Trifolium pratense]|uniref:uncharacterized protein LOC123884817 n=1 Tax=Trifolium pratense TaxID=57577 RepID=UPI001E698288|nr:uncharacterized protein LOC123884817 [Trifolium pratense]XP_045790003.1 uncharacterized protein LOC123884817 [Trifolium pratense]XP_045790009.1 uncharacterized protein LOC123884817 [Trifolium pratense]
MRGFSAVDGFVEISESLAEMIKYVANEPSVGLFFIQQHTQNAVPNVIKLKKNVIDKSHETSLHTQDLEDSVTMVKSMKECGFPIVDEMIGDIKKTLATISSKKPKGVLLRGQSASNFHTERTSFWRSSSVDPQEGSEKRHNYFSSVFMFSKVKQSIPKWSQLDSTGSMDPDVPLSVIYASNCASSQGMEVDELSLPSQIEDESQPEKSDTSDIENKLLLVTEKYDDFKASKQAKLEEWLEGSSNHDCRTSDENENKP